MTIKTVTTVDGINVVDFGNTINEYYWFRNLGDTTIYVSNKEDFKAGDDGVSELTAKGDITNIESFDGKVYILGAGKVEIHNTDSKLPPFKSAPVAGGGGGEVTVAEWNYTPPYDPGGLLANIMNTTGYNGGGYDIGSIQGRFGFCQSYSGYNITHSTPIDLTNVKKITVNGGTVANKDSLSTTAYYCISSETITELDDRWTEIHSSTGTVVSDFIAEIDCSEITGEKFLYLAVKHGDEVSAYTSYFYIDKITLSGDGTNVKYAEYAGNADTVDGLHADSFALKTDIPTSLPANGGNADTVDGLHADDFVNATDFNNYQIPINTDVPAWIYENGKRYQRYMTNSANTGMTNIPNDSINWIWYWYDGLNIFALEMVTGKHYICDVINGSFSGWKDVYTSGFKPYVTGIVTVDSNGKANVSFGFFPSFVLYAPTSPKSGIIGSVYSARAFNATGFTPSADTYTGGLTGSGLEYIAFK